MTALVRLVSALSIGAMLLACGNAPETAALGVVHQEVNACDEKVPAMRAVDGFPAYAQCAGVENGAVWSNNGIDTASSSQGPGWVRTQSSGGYQCTEFARRYFMFRWGIDYQHGDAGEWCDGTLPSTLALATSPTHGDLIVFAPGSCGADPTTGHIAVVDTVDMAGGKVTVVEQNQASRRSTRQSCAACYLHAVKNDGSAGGSGAGGAATGGAATGGVAAGGVTNGVAGAGSSTGGSSAPPVAGGAASNTTAGTANLGTGGSATGIGGAAASGGASSSGAPSSGDGNENSGSDSSCRMSRAGSSSSPSMAAGLLLLGAALLCRRGVSR